MASIDEREPLLSAQPNLARDTDVGEHAAKDAHHRRATTVRAVGYGVLTAAFVVAVVCMLFFWDKIGRAVGALPGNPEDAARRLLQSAPVIVSVNTLIVRNTLIAFLRRTDTSVRLLVLLVRWTHA